MDKTLENILSLIPTKPDGKFVHGALKKFATSIGFKDGHIISDWIAGNSESYKNYLYQISALYNVSVEWLKGETDDPAPGCGFSPCCTLVCAPVRLLPSGGMILTSQRTKSMYTPPGRAVVRTQ